ncbi:MAG: helix-turn-helix domain-containing protein [Candidatus Thorarchaeota archaeon]
MKDEKFTRLRTTFVQTLEELVKFRGNDPMIARIYAMIVLSPEPLTQEQIAKATGYSRSQISRYLANLEQRQMVTKDAERFIKSRLQVIDHLLAEWKTLPENVKVTGESRKLKEVVTVFSAWFGSYLDLLTDFNQRFNERMKKLERDLLLMKF